ncbi:type II toxin-antitoxin system ParD family antitoxin [Methylobacterium sp. E-065]|uniref:type II toxin-antitoxin system ParD family antitoxin n=1 Tax=Methylobacterium sp. E-065 TaxID=2836583 RepID=UPI001FBBBBDA|nr:type II toxin-antitoxin system ParD family antitoxin [Methylobacterium sp. E-065]MCJ2021231.1 type II toxin-antitoxin system ParD family antitoxin [Methylobacterium sp. E-065]
MVTRKPLSVSLTPELHAFVADMVKAGSYTSFSEVVREGLRLLQERKRAVPPSGGVARTRSGER